jgi:hypothetical protein
MKKIRGWRIIYVVCCLVYMGWMINVGTNEFDRINSQYRRIVAQLDAGRIRAVALEELSAECRRESALRADREEDACLSWPDPVVETREKAVEERLIRARERGTIKLVLFYAGFVIIFLLAMPVLIYLLLVGIITLYKNIKIVR